MTHQGVTASTGVGRMESAITATAIRSRPSRSLQNSPAPGHMSQLPPSTTRRERIDAQGSFLLPAPPSSPQALTPLIAPPTTTTCHHHGAGLCLQSVLFCCQCFTSAIDDSSRRTKQHAVTHASRIVVITVIASHRPHTPEGGRGAKKNHQQCPTDRPPRVPRRAVTSEQPAHQGHAIVAAGRPSTIDVNQHTLALALRTFAISCPPPSPPALSGSHHHTLPANCLLLKRSNHWMLLFGCHQPLDITTWMSPHFLLENFI